MRSVKEKARTLEFERNDAVLDGHDVDVSAVGDEVGAHVVENQVNVGNSEFILLGGVESRRGGRLGGGASQKDPCLRSWTASF